jgi:hypothetical protein
MRKKKDGYFIPMKEKKEGFFSHEKKKKKALTRYFLNLAILEDITAIDRLELQVAGDLGVEQNLHERSARHDELGNQVNIPVCES